MGLGAPEELYQPGCVCDAVNCWGISQVLQFRSGLCTGEGFLISSGLFVVLIKNLVSFAPSVTKLERVGFSAPYMSILFSWQADLPLHRPS